MNLPHDPEGAGPAADPISRLRSLDLEAHLGDPAIKQRFVTPMFDVIAPRYDDFTHRFSFGMDRHWKRDAVALVAREAPAGAHVVDIACGTGDLALSVARARSDVRVTGIDASPRMLALANERAAGTGAARVEFLRGDLADLPLRDASVDVVTGGYAIRNAPARHAALGELARVLRPGGHFVALDFYRPRLAPWRALYLGYLSAAGSIVGWLWHRLPVTYAYIARSIDHFVSWQDFSTELEESGFRVRAVERRLGGGIAVHHAVRR